MKKHYFTILILVLFTLPGCQGMQYFGGIDGESTDAQHDSWTDLDATSDLGQNGPGSGDEVSVEPEPEGPGSGDEMPAEQEGPGSGDEVSNSPEPSGPGSGDEVDLGNGPGEPGPGSGDTVDNTEPTGPGSGDEVPNDPEPTGPGSGDEVPNDPEPTGPGSGDEVPNDPEPSGPGSGDEEPAGPGSGDEVVQADEKLDKVKSSCNKISDGSVCIEYIGSFWSNISFTTQNCSDGGAWSEKPCPRPSLGACDMSAGTAQEIMIHYYNYGGDPITPDNMPNVIGVCNANPFGNWLYGT